MADLSADGEILADLSADETIRQILYDVIETRHKWRGGPRMVASLSADGRPCRAMCPIAGYVVIETRRKWRRGPRTVDPLGPCPLAGYVVIETRWK